MIPKVIMIPENDMLVLNWTKAIADGHGCTIDWVETYYSVGGGWVIKLKDKEADASIIFMTDLSNILAKQVFHKGLPGG